ncbi:hypothetical protein Amsp01_018100 [Amycolatopsis sp. NBRC 101858]|uniref:hypothetical protein n=1 Tax=Amycolatopsis sp. NBRC 101858 TaxID=3032200 RepID=UPI0024A4B6F3|nr:hypothetical protein [Amycolatopsis sp. NBRC 101858]GLY35786.1 hypothetical protein Amsp01_018100 [Amycolatopsis sp. NBRC 101858]
MPEHAAVRTTDGEGVDRVVEAAPRDLTVREAILAAAELNGGVPEPRAAAAPAGAAGSEAEVDERRRHG